MDSASGICIWPLL
jgi:hypothetical protein